MSERLGCPFCGCPHPSWRRDDVLLSGDGAVVCGSLSCGVELLAPDEAAGWRRWNQRAPVSAISWAPATCATCGNDKCTCQPAVIHAELSGQFREILTPLEEPE